MVHKVCILAAGKGSRMNFFTEHFNKALIPIHGKPVINYIIEGYGSEREIVFALGYKGDDLKMYIETSYPNRTFTFVTVDNYEAPGSGPGYSLLCCKKHLQCPFILANIDALVKGSFDEEPESNWFCVFPVDDTTRFCSVKVDDSGKVIRINDKEKTDNKYAFTGIAGIKDFELFWSELSSNKKIIANEIQVSNGFSALEKSGLYIKVLDWFDTGTEESYKNTLKNFTPIN